MTRLPQGTTTICRCQREPAVCNRGVFEVCREGLVKPRGRCGRCLLITVSPKTLGHYRYLNLGPEVDFLYTEIFGCVIPEMSGHVSV